MSRTDLIYLAATLKCELIKISTPNANTNIESWVGFFSKESVKDAACTPCGDWKTRSAFESGFPSEKNIPGYGLRNHIRGFFRCIISLLLISP